MATAVAVVVAAEPVTTSVARRGAPLEGEAPAAERPRTSARPRRRRSSWRELSRRFLEPPRDRHVLVDGAPPLTLREIARRYWPDARPFCGWNTLNIALGSLLSAVTVIEIALFAYVVDDVLVPAEFGPLVWIGAAYLGLAVLSGILSGVNSYLSTWLSQTFLIGFRSRLFAHLLSLPQEVHDRRRLGDSMTRITGDAAAVESFMIGNVRSGAISLITCVWYLIALFLLDTRLAAASLIVVPIFWAVSHRFSRLIKLSAREQRRRGGSLSAITEEHLGNAPLVQAFNRQSDALGRFTRETLGIRSAALAAARVRALLSPVVDLAELVGVLTVIVLGTHALASGRLSLGGLLAFLTMMVQLYQPMRSLTRLLPGVLADAAGCERIAELLDEAPPAERADAITLPLRPTDVVLAQVTVTYPRATSPALSGVCLRFTPGSIIAVTGPSGAGKSTLVKLLLRAIDPDIGAVRVGGHDLRDVTLASVREVVSLVPQEIALLDASVGDNIGFARKDATLADIEAAARAASAEEFIEGLPRGYATLVGQKARTLSGGQRQRLSLARAFLRESPLLLLDEPTTGLDADTARRVLEPLRHGAASRTTIIVTHDPVALEIADRVITLDQGRVLSDLPVINRSRRRVSA